MSKIAPATGARAVRCGGKLVFIAPIKGCLPEWVKREMRRGRAGDTKPGL
jgi:hypothetical protein